MADIINSKPNRKFIDYNGLVSLWGKIKELITSKTNAITNDIQTNKSYRGYHVVKHNVTSGTTSEITLLYNTYNIINVSGTAATTINFVFGIENETIDDVNFTCEYVIEFISNDNITITTPTDIAWEDAEALEFESGYRYIISFIKNYKYDIIKAVYGKYPL